MKISKKNFIYIPEDWADSADSPEEFEEAIRNSVSANEKEFLEEMRYKIPYEVAASNEILLKEDENEDGIYILRVGNGDFQIGRISKDSEVPNYPFEIGGLLGEYGFMGFDLYPLLKKHMTVQEWLRSRDYQGIRYDRNNDLS